ncbi:MAG: sigma-70 family RNA polymerase sigma factor [Clostridia bacterium]|nr:sigma-70 family RNA polymerase sigma factor [Clostridia bacterium]
MMTDEGIIELFFARSEKAIAALADKYGNAMHAVSFNILHNEQDTQECVNDAYLSVWNVIPPTHPDPLCAFVCRVCRNVSLTRYHYNKAEKRDGRYNVSLEEIAEIIPSDQTVEREMEDAILTQMLNDWLSELNKVNLYIFMRRYWFCEAVADIARATRLSEAAVYLRLDRMKKKLAKYLTERGILI